MLTTYTQIYDNAAHDPLSSVDRDQLFSDIYQDELGADPKYIIPFKIIQIDNDGVINDITPDYDAYVERRNEEQEAA